MENTQYRASLFTALQPESKSNGAVLESDESTCEERFNVTKGCRLIGIFTDNLQILKPAS